MFVLKSVAGAQENGKESETMILDAAFSVASVSCLLWVDVIISPLLLLSHRAKQFTMSANKLKHLDLQIYPEIKGQIHSKLETDGTVFLCP